MDNAAVGKQIADLRKAKHLTQADLGMRLGVTFQAVSRWERRVVVSQASTHCGQSRPRKKHASAA